MKENRALVEKWWKTRLHHHQTVNFLKHVLLRIKRRRAEENIANRILYHVMKDHKAGLKSWLAFGDFAFILKAFLNSLEAKEDRNNYNISHFNFIHSNCTPFDREIQIINRSWNYELQKRRKTRGEMLRFSKLQSNLDIRQNNL